jgi:hypothetical protein
MELYLLFQKMIHRILNVLLLIHVYALMADCRKYNFGLLVPHSGPRAFGLAVEITVEMAVEKVNLNINMTYIYE